MNAAALGDLYFKALISKLLYCPKKEIQVSQNQVTKASIGRFFRRFGHETTISIMKYRFIL
jgi:hypothetical protein